MRRHVHHFARYGVGLAVAAWLGVHLVAQQHPTHHWYDTALYAVICVGALTVVGTTDGVARRLSAKTFPSARIDVGDALGLNMAAIDPNEHGGSLLRFHADITNRQSDKPLHLVFRGRVENLARSPRKGDPPAYKLSRFFPHSPQQRIHADLPSPVNVAPLDTVSGGFAFIDRLELWIKRDGFTFEPEDGCRVMLTVEDYVSGRSIDFEIPGTWES